MLMSRLEIMIENLVNENPELNEEQFRGHLGGLGLNAGMAEELGDSLWDLYQIIRERKKEAKALKEEETVRPKVLAIVGSFRKGGNTDLIIDRVLSGAASKDARTEKIYVDDLRLGSCQGCYECKPEGVCKQQDDVLKIRNKIEEADGVIVGSPIYGNYMTGQLKMLLDRLMGVLNKRVFVPGEKKFTSVTRLAQKRRNIFIVLVAGAPNEDCGDDALKLLRRMTGSFANGGFVEELVATGITAYGAVAMDEDQLAGVAKAAGVPNPEEAAGRARSRNLDILEKAHRIGIKIVEENENYPTERQDRLDSDGYF
ncbi:MAG: flavodoxin family protein [Clostridia bacterium]|nr:flavodoxin family protein [Clostridia bacterium]